MKIINLQHHDVQKVKNKRKVILVLDKHKFKLDFLQASTISYVLKTHIKKYGFKNNTDELLRHFK